MTPRRVLALLLAALAPALASAQHVNVLVVDAAGGAGSAFTHIPPATNAAAGAAGSACTARQPATNAAASGAVVLVRAGTYTGFSIQAKSLSIVADAGATVDVSGSSHINLLGADQRVELQGLRLRNLQPISGPSEPPLQISDCAGIVWLEGVDATAQGWISTSSIAGLRVTNCASVALLRCTVRAVPAFFLVGGPGEPALRSLSSTLAIDDGTFEGATSFTHDPFGPAPGGPGADIAGGFAFASGATFKGGGGGGSLTIGAPGGPGLLANGTFVSLDCTFVGGPGGLAGTFPAPTGPPTAGSGPITTLAGTARHFEITSPVRELQPATLHFKGLPGENACALLSDLSDPVFIFPLFAGAFCVSLGNVNALLFDVIPPSGASDVAIPMPDFLPSLMGGRIYFQSFFFDPAVTYVVLGPPSLFVLLDSGL